MPDVTEVIMDTDDEIDVLLKRARPPAIADEGFTATVLARLARSRQAGNAEIGAMMRAARLRYDLFSLVGAAIGLAIALFSGSLPSSLDVFGGVSAAWSGGHVPPAAIDVGMLIAIIAGSIWSWARS